MFDQLKFAPRVSLAEDTGLTMPNGRRAQIEKEIDSQTIELGHMLMEGAVEDFNKTRNRGFFDLTHVPDISGKDLSGINLEFVDLSGVPATGVILLGSKLTRLTARGSDISGAILHHDDWDGPITEATFMDLQGAIADRFQAPNVDMSEGKFERIQMIDGYIPGAIAIKSRWSGGIINGLNGSGADLTKARLYRVTAEKGKEPTKFHGTVLVDARGTQMALSYAEFNDANMQDMWIRNARGQKVVFDGANMTNVKAEQAAFDSKTSFFGAYVNGMKHDGFGNSKDLLSDAIHEGKPAEGSYPTSAVKIENTNLIDGIPGTNQQIFDHAHDELHGLIGLQSAKDSIEELLDSKRIEQDELLHGMPELEFGEHYAFLGPAGTGKTTVGKIFGQLLHSLGYLSKGHVVATDRSGLVAGYKGQSALKTKAKVEEAMGGILMIDEAYGLVKDENDTFGEEASEALLLEMSERAGDFVVILLGYPDKMEEYLDSNEGLPSRVNEKIYFPSYNDSELVEIYRNKLLAQQRTIDVELLAHISVLCATERSEGNRTFGNGRFVHNAFKRTIKLQRKRINRERKELPANQRSVRIPRKQLERLILDDLPLSEHIDISRSDFDINELVWEHNEDDRQVKVPYEELSLRMKPFPTLSAESLQLIQKIRDDKSG